MINLMLFTLTFSLVKGELNLIDSLRADLGLHPHGDGKLVISHHPGSGTSGITHHPVYDTSEITHKPEHSSYSSHNFGNGHQNPTMPEMNSKKESASSSEQDKGKGLAEIEPDLGDKKFSELGEDDFRYWFFDRVPGGIFYRKMAVFLAKSIASIGAARRELNILRLKSEKLEQLANQIGVEETFKGSLAHVFSQKKPLKFEEIIKLGEDLNHEEKNLWHESYDSLERKYRMQADKKGFFKSSILFPKGKNQELVQSMWYILRQVRWRNLSAYEKVTLELEKVKNAGLFISEKEKQLAKRISKLSQASDFLDVELSVEERKTLQEISLRPVLVRRHKKLEAILKKFETFKITESPAWTSTEDDNLHIVCKELRELSSKENEGFVWTDDDQKFMIDSEKLSKKLGDKYGPLQLRQLATVLRWKKSVTVLEASAYGPIGTKQEILLGKIHRMLEERNTSKLDNPYSGLTEDNNDHIDFLAMQYFKMKEAIRYARIHHSIDFEKDQFDKEIITTEKQAIQRLKTLRSKGQITDDQKNLLGKLENYVVADKPRVERDAWFEAYRDKVMGFSSDTKVKMLAQELENTPEFPSYVLHFRDEEGRANFFDEVVYSRPILEWWMEGAEKEIMRGIWTEIYLENFLSFKERCKILIYAKEFQALNHDGIRTIEKEALKRLIKLIEISPHGPSSSDIPIPKGVDLYRALSYKKFGKILEEQNTVRKLAIEQALIEKWEVSPSEEQAALDLLQDFNARGIKIFASRWKRSIFLLPKEFVEIARLVSLPDNDKKFESVNKYCHILDVVLRASDHKEFQRYVEWQGQSPEKLFRWELDLIKTHQEKLFNERAMMQKMNQKLWESVTTMHSYAQPV